MKRVVKLTEKDLTNIVKRVISEQELEEGIMDTIKNIKDKITSIPDIYRGAKGLYRGYGMDFFKNMSRLQRLTKELKRLDIPNEKVMNELKNLKTKVSSLNIPQANKDQIVNHIDKTLQSFDDYSKNNDVVLSDIQTLNIDSWK